MEITSYPAQRSSAYRDAIFTLSATETEPIDLDIREESQNLLLGQKRLYGQNTYSVNVSNYAQRLLDVTPLRSQATVFDYPQKRMAPLLIQAGDMKGTVTLTSSLEKILFFEPLSKAPDTVSITPEQSDEIALFTDDSALFAEIILDPPRNSKKIRLAEKNKKTDLCALYFNMPHVVRKVNEAKWGPIEQYRELQLQIITEYDELIFTRNYLIDPPSANSLRLCWWNYWGQIDYASFKLVQTSLNIDKQRIYTAQGYKTTGCQTGTLYELVSDYRNAEHMAWLQEIVAAPKVWSDNGTEFLPVEILTQQMITGGHDLARLQINLTPSQKSIYQHL